MTTVRFGVMIPFSVTGNGYKQREAFNAAVKEYNSEGAPGGGGYETIDAHRLLPAIEPGTINILLSGPDESALLRPDLAARVLDEIKNRKLQ